MSRGAEDDCWLWSGARNNNGYGHLGGGGEGGGTVYAHRAAWESVRGEIPEGLTVDHVCRVRLCCNPAHMELVTPYVNNMRGDSQAAMNARKTHCPQGHAYDQANTYVPPGAPRNRVCRTCVYARLKASRAR